MHLDQTLDVVYLVKHATVNAELKYSLRSLCNLPFSGNVWIAGFKPPWVTGVKHLPFLQHEDKYRNAWKGMMALCVNDEMSENVILMDDDFFVTEPVDEIPVYWKGLVEDSEEDWSSKRNSKYIEGYFRTAQVMRGWGFESLRNYELHMPFVVNRGDYHSVLLAAREETEYLPLRRKLLYGNFYNIGGEFHDDCKVTGLDVLPDVDFPFVSTNDVSFRDGLVGEYLRDLFPDKCEYEK